MGTRVCAECLGQRVLVRLHDAQIRSAARAHRGCLQQVVSNAMALVLVAGSEGSLRDSLRTPLPLEVVVAAVAMVTVKLGMALAGPLS